MACQLEDPTGRERPGSGLPGEMRGGKIEQRKSHGAYRRAKRVEEDVIDEDGRSGRHGKVDGAETHQRQHPEKADQDKRYSDGVEAPIPGVAVEARVLGVELLFGHAVAVARAAYCFTSENGSCPVDDLLTLWPYANRAAARRVTMSSRSLLCSSGAAIFILALSACAGHAGFVPPGASRNPGVQSARLLLPATTARTRVRFRIAVPGRTRLSVPHRIFPAYVSTSTQKAAFVVQGQSENKPEPAQVFACTNVCTGSVSLPAGVDRITVTLKDRKGRHLCTGTASVLIFAKENNPLHFTLDGIVSKVDLVPTPAVLPVVPASQGSVLFEARDADGNVIMPNGQYVDIAGRALVFDVTSGDAALKLRTTIVSAPGSPIPFSYNGKLHLGTVTITPSAHPGTTTSARFTAANIRFVPGIARRLPPPVPMQALAVTQVRFQGGGSPSDSYLVTGNAAGNWVIFTFNRDSAVYALAASGPGFFAGPPLDNTAVAPLYGTNALYGFTRDPSGTYDSRVFSSYGAALPNAGNPCANATDVPIAGIPSTPSTTYCQRSTSSGAAEVIDASGAIFASGLARKIEGFAWQVNGTPVYHVYVLTAAGLYEDTGGADALPGATAIGRNESWYATGSQPYIGYATGAVELAGTRVAKFSHAIESLTGAENPSGVIYAMEQGGTFGVHTSTGLFETSILPIGNVVDVIPGLDYPVLVESDGTLDVMGI